jgi:hypothetical protein
MTDRSVLAALFTFMSLLSLLTSCGSNTEQPAIPQIQGGTIQGFVRESDTDRPITAADVYVVSSRNQPVPRTTSDVDGRFVLSGLDSGRHLIAVSKSGYVLPQRLESSGYTFRVTSSETVNAGALYLIPAGSLSGRVLKPDGQPARRVEIQLLQNLFVLGRRQLAPVVPLGIRSRIETNDRGEFRAVGVDPGEYFVRLNPREVTVESVTPGGRPPGPTLYPGVRDPGRATPVRVSPGRETRLDDVRLATDVRGWIKVFVVDKSAEELEGLGEWSLEPPGWIGSRYPLFHDRTVNNAHEFQPDLPGTYEISASWSTASGPVTGRIRAVYTGAAQEMRLVLERPKGRVVGTVMLQQAGGVRPLAGAEVAIGPDIPYFASANVDGALVLPHVYPGRYKLGYVRGIPEDAYILSVKANGRDVLREDLTVGTGETKLEVVIGERGGKIDGKVTDADGQPTHNALVALVPEGPLKKRTDYYGAWQSIRTDQNGGFELRGITPGAYGAYAWSGVPASAFRNDEFIGRFAGKGISVMVEAGEEISLDLTLLEAR